MSLGPLPYVERPLVFMGTVYPDVPHTARIVRCIATAPLAANASGTLQDVGSGSFLVSPARIDGLPLDPQGEWEARILSLGVYGRIGSTAPAANGEKCLYTAVRNTLDAGGNVVQAVNLHNDMVTGTNNTSRRVDLIGVGPLPVVPFVPLHPDLGRLGYNDQIVVAVQHAVGSTLGTVFFEAQAFLAVYQRPRAEA